jgi:hypothetical protein
MNTSPTSSWIPLRRIRLALVLVGALVVLALAGAHVVPWPLRSWRSLGPVEIVVGRKS